MGEVLEGSIRKVFGGSCSGLRLGIYEGFGFGAQG